MSGRVGSRSLARKISRTFSAPSDAASQGVIRASIALQSHQTNTFPGPAMRAGRTSRASLRATGTSTGSAAASVGVAAAVGDRVDQRRFRGAVLAEDVAGQILNLRAAAGHAPSLASAGEAILTAQHAIDLLRLEAGELFWRGPGAVKAQRCDLVGLGLRRIEAAIGALGVEHREHAGDAIARQAEFERLRLRRRRRRRRRPERRPSALRASPRRGADRAARRRSVWPASPW